jgi:hypothetical protein
VGIVRGRSCASILVDPRRKPSLFEAFQGGGGHGRAQAPCSARGVTGGHGGLQEGGLDNGSSCGLPALRATRPVRQEVEGKKREKEKKEKEKKWKIF